MLQMRVGQYHFGDARRRRWKGRPIAQTKLLEALKQAAIDQKPAAIAFEQIFGAGDGPHSPEEGQFDVHAISPHPIHWAYISAPCSKRQNGAHDISRVYAFNAKTELRAKRNHGPVLAQNASYQK